MSERALHIDLALRAGQGWASLCNDKPFSLLSPSESAIAPAHLQDTRLPGYGDPDSLVVLPVARFQVREGRVTAVYLAETPMVGDSGRSTFVHYAPLCMCPRWDENR